MLSGALRRLPSVQIVNGDATHFSTDGSFSGAACFTMLRHVPSAPNCRTELFAEVARVLRPGAALVGQRQPGQ